MPSGLKAGLNPLQVVHEVLLGDPPVQHAGVGFESNVAALVVAPQITTIAPVVASAGGTLTLAVKPDVGREQRVAVLVGETALAVPPRKPTDPPTSASVEVGIPGNHATGTFLLRVQVDGAISALQVDDDPNSPTFEQYVGPLVEVTP